MKTIRVVTDFTLKPRNNQLEYRLDVKELVFDDEGRLVEIRDTPDERLPSQTLKITAVAG